MHMSVCLPQIQSANREEAAATALHCVDFLQALHAMLLSQVSSGCAGPGPTLAASPQQYSGCKQRSSNSGSAACSRQWTNFRRCSCRSRSLQRWQGQKPRQQLVIALPADMCVHRHRLWMGIVRHNQTQRARILYTALVLSLYAARHCTSCDCVAWHFLAFSMSLPSVVYPML